MSPGSPAPSFAFPLVSKSFFRISVVDLPIFHVSLVFLSLLYNLANSFGMNVSIGEFPFF